MLKIDERLKWKEIPKYITEQLGFVDIFNIRFGIATFVFLMIDFFMVIPLFIPLVPAYLYILLPPLVIINLWGIWILVRNPYSVQYEVILIMAAMGIFASAAYLVLAHKMAYYYVGVRGWSYYAIVTLLYVLTTFWILHYCISRFKDLSYEAMVKMKNEERKRDRGKGKIRAMNHADKYIAILLYVPGIGYLIVQIVKYNETGVAFTLIICFLSFAFLFSYIAIKFTHRIFMMKANPQRVHLRTPGKSMYKNGLVKRDLKIK